MRVVGYTYITCTPVRCGSVGVVQYSWSMVAAHEMSRTYLMCCGSKVGWAVVEATARLG